MEFLSAREKWPVKCPYPFGGTSHGPIMPVELQRSPQAPTRLIERSRGCAHRSKNALAFRPLQRLSHDSAIRHGNVPPILPREAHRKFPSQVTRRLKTSQQSCIRRDPKTPACTSTIRYMKGRERSEGESSGRFTTDAFEGAGPANPGSSPEGSSGALRR